MTDCLELWVDDWQWPTGDSPVVAPGVANLQGWFGTSQDDGQMFTSANAPGSVPGRWHAAEAAITVEGSIEGGPRDLMTVIDRLAALRDGSLHTVRVRDALRETRRLAKVVRVDVDITEAVFGSVPFVVDMIAPDPRRYSAPTTYYGGERITNGGTAPSEPTIRIVGPAVNPTITEQQTGRRLSWVGTLAAGQTLTLDPAVGRAVVNGTPVMGMLRWEWPTVPAGQSRSYAVSAGSLYIDGRSAWW